MAQDTEPEDGSGENLTSRAVRAIRPYLPELVGERAGALDAELRERLRRPNGTDAALELLEIDPATNAWLADFFETGLPPELAPRSERGGYAPLAGNSIPAGPPRYTCPVDGNYDWYRVEIAEEVPECPDHPGTRLVRA